MLRILSKSLPGHGRRLQMPIAMQSKLGSSVIVPHHGHHLAPGLWTACRRTAVQHVGSGFDEITKATRIVDFEGAGRAVADEFLAENDVIMDEANWRRVKTMDALAKELVDLHAELDELMKVVTQRDDVTQQMERVKHLGHQVYVQYNKEALDADAEEGSPATITRIESRSVVDHALRALKSRKRVCVTGQPGIGKTRGSMMYALQTLLCRKAAVLYLGLKGKKVLLFLPSENGNYRVWSCTRTSFAFSVLQLDNRVVALIDPPERGSYDDTASCRVLKFVSNNSEKHFRNWEKDGILLVTSMPSEEEVVAMTEVLWSDKWSPPSNEIGKVLSIEDKQEVIRERIKLVGPVPRHVFDLQLYEKAITDCLSGARQVVEKLTEKELFDALRGTYSTLLENHPANVSSKVFFLKPKQVPHKTWRARSRHRPQLQLTPIAIWALRNELETVVSNLRPNRFEDFAFHRKSRDLGCIAEVQGTRSDNKSTEAGFEKMKTLSDSDNVLYRPCSKNFPLVDFVKSNKKWYNAKSGDRVVVALDGAFRFFEGMGLVQARSGGHGWMLAEKGKRLRADFVLLTKKKVEVILKPASDIKKHGHEEHQKEIFDKLVKLEVEDISKAGDLQLDDFINLNELDTTITQQLDGLG